MYIDPVRYEGRPGNVPERLEKEQRCYALLDELQIPYARVDHEHADTIEACEAVEQVLGEKICKNLFLCNRQKTQFYLLMLEGEKVFKTKDLSRQLGVARLSFAAPADMEKYLDITPGSVSIMGLMNDPENHVQLLLDKDVKAGEFIGCHPCINTSSLKLYTKDIFEKFLPAVHHEPIFVELTGE
jgi:Ala-tRNA(Pro) deacylase